MSPWALPVPLQPNELFSSWLARAALEQGCDPLVLTGEIWPKWRAWVRDLDRGVSEERLQALGKASGIDRQCFEAASLRPTASLITSVQLGQRAVWPWVLVQGQRNRKRLGGLQFCPLCLAEARRPYYRLQWRLAWHVSCPTHGVLLHDRCGHCEAPVQPHRLLAEDSHLAVCAVCKNDLRTVSSVGCSSAASVFQEAADSVIHHGFGYYGDEKLNSHEWFRLARYFLYILRRVALRPNDSLSVMLERLGVNPMLPSVTGLPLEMLPVEERVPLLTGSWLLISAGPSILFEAAVRSSVTQATFAGVCKRVPHTIRELMSALPSGTVPRKEVKYERTAHSYQPRSRQAVMRMYARLQRKMALKS